MAALSASAAKTLWQGAIDVLRENDLGEWTRPAPSLYPHQWSWDSAFIAIGLSHVNPARALRELRALLRGQWADGRIPHIVFNPLTREDAYFPGPSRWSCLPVGAPAPREPLTSGICQPPVHALALHAILDLPEIGPQAPLWHEVADLYPGLLRWHRYLASSRDPDSQGLITIYHPWESGTDNSPRWDAPLARVGVGDMPPYTRRDLAHVIDPSHRPTDAEYDRYIWLVESLKLAGYVDEVIRERHPFRVKDALFSAIFAAANAALAAVANRLNRPSSERDELAELEDRFSRGVGACWSESLGLALDFDLRARAPIEVKTFAGLAPLLLPRPAGGLADEAAARLESAEFAGHPSLGFPVVPSTVPNSVGFRPATYWRGPSWPVMNWLLWRGLRQHGKLDAAQRLRDANLALLAQPAAEFAEYFHPFTGEPLGSRHQSWTAAAALDWLAQGDK